MGINTKYVSHFFYTLWSKTGSDKIWYNFFVAIILWALANYLTCLSEIIHLPLDKIITIC